MSKKQVLFAGSVILYVFWHIFLLSYYPLPWFDETYFASISLNFIEHGSFIPQVAYHARDGREALTYGPVYFFLTGIPVKLFGLGILQFRIVNLLFGFLCIWVTCRILQIKRSEPAALLLVAIFAMDPFFNLSMHEGRMDITALFFVLLSLYFILRNGKRDVYYSALTGSLALMTTPRSAVILAAVAMVLLMNSYKDGQYRTFLTWMAVLLGIYALWVLYAFGSPVGYLHYYQALQGNENQVNHDFLGGRFYIPRQEYVLIITALFSILFNIIRKKYDFPDMLSSVSIAVILLFYVIVLDWGPYSVLILPFYYMIIFNKAEFRWSLRDPRLYMLIILLTHNVCYFALKSANIVSSINQRDPSVADQFIADNIPAGSKVVGDPLYFYSVKRAGSDYQFFDKYGTLEARERKHRELYNYDYIIITEQSLKREGEAVAWYMDNSRLQKVAELKIPQSALNRQIASLGLVSDTESSGYNASIYIRIKAQDTLPMAILR